MEFIQNEEPDVEKPIIIAAMQDMGNVGNIVVNFINESLGTKIFRTAKTSFPTYVIDKGGYIDLPDEEWEYRCTEDLVVFGGGKGQPQSNDELNALCQDVIDVAKKYSAKFIYTLGGFHTNRIFGNSPKTYITTTSRELTKHMEGLDVETTPQRSIITGFNGLILGFAKKNEIQGIGMYGELNEPEIPQYRSAISIIKTLEKLTYRKFGDTSQLEIRAKDIERKFKN
ncbi:MAG: PAC2 family protein [Nitrosopumilus sp.]|nr:PAC2 family protein [Nitrosopumilus sp.]MDF2423254.1 PAC2 family protein [Nitrosopumilus sp.]MDF2424198.1 PAC2 family protein [Nitrosopumilus sp.]MDF2425072.1 PAC2 family protein [Nitrosopumilus sp.]MDF2426316.1 PAC2 family protein [Nitrosopumilus sp.]